MNQRIKPETAWHFVCWMMSLLDGYRATETEYRDNIGEKNMKSFIRYFAMVAITVLWVTAASAIPTTDTLANLKATGGSVGIGDKVFSGFDFTPSGLTSFNPSQINVTASIVGGIYFLTYGGNISFASVGTASADLLLTYTVTASAGRIDAIDQNYTGSAQSGALAIDETAKVGIMVVGYSHLQVGDLSDPFAEVGDILDINPAQSVLLVTKDITLFTTGGATDQGAVSISQIQQSFHQVQVPDGGTTVLLLGAALSALGLIKRRLA